VCKPAPIRCKIVQFAAEYTTDRQERHQNTIAGHKVLHNRAAPVHTPTNLNGFSRPRQPCRHSSEILAVHSATLSLSNAAPRSLLSIVCAKARKTVVTNRRSHQSPPLEQFKGDFRDHPRRHGKYRHDFPQHTGSICAMWWNIRQTQNAIPTNTQRQSRSSVSWANQTKPSLPTIQGCSSHLLPLTLFTISRTRS
jgi:hypothetical protein